MRNPTIPLAAALSLLTLGACDAAQSQVAELPGCFLRGADRVEAAERPSPLDSATVEVGEGAVKICYGSPRARGREVMGALVPWDQPWRMGANEATALHTNVPVDVGGVTLDPGSYALYAIPGQEAWTVALGRGHERWGIPINEEVIADDVGRTTAEPTSLDEPVENLTYRFETGSDGGTELVMEWERTRLAIPVQALDT